MANGLTTFKDGKMYIDGKLVDQGMYNSIGESNPDLVRDIGNNIQFDNNGSQSSGVRQDKPIDWFGDKGLGSTTGLGGMALGSAQLGLGVMQYLDSSKTAGLQRDVLKQQIANNQYTMDDRKAGSAISMQNASDFKANFGGFNTPISYLNTPKAGL